jgi:hypothetical protein
MEMYDEKFNLFNYEKLKESSKKEHHILYYYLKNRTLLNSKKSINDYKYLIFKKVNFEDFFYKISEDKYVISYQLILIEEDFSYQANYIAVYFNYENGFTITGDVNTCSLGSIEEKEKILQLINNLKTKTIINKF